MKAKNNCWVCLRITPALCLKLAHKLWKEPEVARQIGLETAKLIEQIYSINRFYLCGKQTKTILGGIFYILNLRHYPENGIRVTQDEIWRALDVTNTTIRVRYMSLLETFPELFPDFKYTERYGWVLNLPEFKNLPKSAKPYG